MRDEKVKAAAKEADKMVDKVANKDHKVAVETKKAQLGNEVNTYM